jgi:CRISPR-associated endonuclease/helicase Cas3
MKTICSHPDKPLINHLTEVANNCKTTISQLQLDARLQGVIADVAYICGAFHDLGKATEYFQHYLLTKNNEIIGPKNHALISALFVKEVTKLYLTTTKLTIFEQELFSHFAFTAVKRHHGNLNNFEDELIETVQKRKELIEQVEVFIMPGVQQIIDNFLDKLAISYSFNDFKHYITNAVYDDEFFEFYDENISFGEFADLQAESRINYFFLHQLLFSTLLLSDKTDVILSTPRHSRVMGSALYEALEGFRERAGFNAPTKDIDKLKNKAYFESLASLSDIFDEEQHIYSVTLPTGLGKTITSFGVALAMKQLCINQNRRLVIAIPYTSIIDQNFEVYKSILSNPSSEVLLKHHHLTSPEYKTEDDEVGAVALNSNEASFLIETWQSEVVVTTFVQLLDSIFSNRKGLLMKLPNLANSIIILDEVQTVPYVHWQLIKESLAVIGKSFNCYFIFMSATQPLIFDPASEIIEIVPNYKSYFEYFNRTRLINKSESTVTLTEFSEEIAHYIAENEQKDILVILNTKKHSKACFEMLRECITLGADEIVYLSTLITPYERKGIIEAIKRKGIAKRMIIVSTQLIEAGVDISVDTVFRVIAPLDSVIQAAGRANRYNEKTTQGEVFLYDVKELQKASSMIYGADLILKTKNILKGLSYVEESDYLSLIESYFKEVKRQSDGSVSTYYTAIQKLQFAEVGKFSLIEQEYESESIFIQLNSDAVEAWEGYVRIYANNDLSIFEKRMAFAEIKSTFYDFVISVPLKRGEKQISFDREKTFGFYVSYLNNPSAYYSYDFDNISYNTGYQEIQHLVL